MDMYNNYFEDAIYNKPSLNPPGCSALLSPGTVFLFTVTLHSSRTLVARSPSKP